MRMNRKRLEKASVGKIYRYIQALCGLYSRVARNLGVDRSYVSRVAKGERRSQTVENAIISEFEEIIENGM